MCLYPKLIKNRKYIANKKNGGNIPAVIDNRVLYVPIKCGKCMECMKSKSREWSVRLNEELRHNNKMTFVTLTFSNENIIKLKEEIEKKHKIEGYEIDNEIVKLAVRRFCERWRKKYKKSIKHWLVSELGHNGTKNVHIHGILWSDNKNDIDKIWNYGYTWCGEFVNKKTINYIVKYIHKTDQENKYYIPKILCSPGIGKEYVNSYNYKISKYNGSDTKEYYRTLSGHKISLPIYYRNKVYNEDEREKLWLNKLDKEERYVNGIKIDISKGDENYYKALNYARTLNKILGYNDDSINWNKKRYENEKRNLMYKERSKKIKETNYIIPENDNIKEIIGNLNEAF